MTDRKLQERTIWVTLPEIPLSLKYGMRQDLWGYVQSIPKVLCALAGLSYTEWSVDILEMLDRGPDLVRDSDICIKVRFFRKDRPSLRMGSQPKRKIRFSDE